MDDTNQRHKAGERIAKVIARAGLASRREAEQWIAAGRVAVNGTVIDSPARNVSAADRVSVDGEPLPGRTRTRLFLYHKPRGLVTTHADPQGRPTIFQRLPKDLPRLISVGRLDFNTEGLLLLTNDGGLARVLELPASGWLRRYRVRAHGSVTQAKLDELRAGATVDGIRYGAIEATLDRVQGSNLWLTFAIREGKNREVRNVLGEIGLTVTRLIRVSFGPFQLRDLAEGAVEEVPTRVLREQLGDRVVALSGADFSAPAAVPAPPAKSERPRERVTQGATGDKSTAHRSPRDQPTGRQPPSHKATSQHPPGPKKPGRKTAGRAASHTWRAADEERPAKKLRRKFRGSRRDDETRREPAAAGPRAGLVADRKGRRILVERVGAARPPAAPKDAARKPHRRPPGARGRQPRRR